VCRVLRFEKALNCPQGQASIFYYKRKVTVSNLTVYDVRSFEGNRYVYDQTIAKRGSAEVASFLVHFIERKVLEGYREFRLFSDNCSGQNKNRMVASALLHAAAKFNIKITRNFLEKGHTFNRADGTHSLSERSTRP